MFRAIDIWRRVNDSEVVRYRCFQSLRTGRYCVQSADSYRLPDNLNQERYLERQYIQLLIEQAPDERGGAYDTLEAAIEAHDAEFNPPR